MSKIEKIFSVFNEDTKMKVIEILVNGSNVSTVNFEHVFVEREITHFSPVSHFYIPWKRQTTFGFLTFSGGIEMRHWTKMG